MIGRVTELNRENRSPNKVVSGFYIGTNYVTAEPSFNSENHLIVKSERQHFSCLIYRQWDFATAKTDSQYQARENMKFVLSAGKLTIANQARESMQPITNAKSGKKNDRAGQVHRTSAKRAKCTKIDYCRPSAKIKCGEARVWSRLTLGWSWLVEKGTC